MLQEDGSVGKGTIYQTWHPEFNPQNPQDKRRDPISHKLASDLHMNTMTHMDPHIYE